MANVRFTYTDLMRGSAVTLLTNTVGSWDLTRPTSFILSPWRKKVARSLTSGSDVDLIIDLGSAQSFNAAFLVQPKLHGSGGTVKIQAHSANLWTTPAFSSASFPAVELNRRLTGLYFSTQTYRYVRILWTNVGAVTDYVELGYLMLGTYYEPTYNITDQLVTKPNDPSVVNEAYDGEVQAFEKTKFDTVDFFLEAMPGATDRVSFQTMFNSIGITRPLVLAVDADVMNLTYYGHFTDFNIEFASGTVNDWDISGNFREAR